MDDLRHHTRGRFHGERRCTKSAPRRRGSRRLTAPRGYLLRKCGWAARCAGERSPRPLRQRAGRVERWRHRSLDETRPQREPMRGALIQMGQIAGSCLRGSVRYVSEARPRATLAYHRAQAWQDLDRLGRPAPRAGDQRRRFGDREAGSCASSLRRPAALHRTRLDGGRRAGRGRPAAEVLNSPANRRGRS